MTTYLTRDRAIADDGAPVARRRRVLSPLEVLAQQALALEAQAHALVATILAQLEEQAEDTAPEGPATPPVFGGRPRPEPTTEPTTETP